MVLRRIAIPAALATLFGALLVTVPADVPALAVTPACTSSQPDSARAAAMAKACGRPVEDLSLRTEASTTTDNPDGTQVLTQYAEPRWARGADGSWGDIDTTLRAVDGSVVPARGILPVAFSAGGAGPLARLGRGAYEVSLSWPAALPAPALAGNTATYSEVLPGVDLRLTAQAEGFDEVLVVKTRAAAASAALGRVTFGLAGKGVTVAGLADGGAEARNARGETVFTSPTPMMWDSGADPAAAAGTGRLFPRVARMAASFAGSSVSLTPDRSLLTASDAVFPLYLDPSWTGHISGNMWKNVASRSDVVNSTSFTLLNGSTAGDAGSGRICDTLSGGSCTSTQYLVRSLFRMETYGVAGKHVIAATFNITQKWSFTCNPASNAQLWITGGISSSTTWNTQPGWDSGHTAQTAANHRYDSGASCAGTGNDAFNATAMVQYALSQGWPDLTLGLRAVSESTIYQWKRFAASSANLAIVYNSYPNVPDTFSTAGQSGCVTGSGRPVVAVGNPVLQARVTDPDGSGEGDINGSLKGDFAWESWNPSTSAWSAIGSALGTPQANGTTSPAPAPAFSTGIYRWHVRAADSWSYPNFGSGTDYSAYGAWCEFEVDLTPPSTPDLSPDAGNAPFVAGRTVRLSAGPGGSPADTDVTGYNWWVVDGGGTHATTFVPGTTVSLDWTPIAGPATIFVQAKDRIQLGPTASYGFTAAQLSTETARWQLAEPNGSGTAYDGTGNGHDATATGTVSFGAPGRIVNGATALGLDGSAGSGVDTAAAVIDTSKTFTVSAWATVAARTSNLVLASQSGGAHVPFTLGYVAGTGEDRWEFVTYNSAGAVTGRVRSSAAPVIGVWTHLTATYDSGADTLALYVNGVAQGSAGGVQLWASSGPFQIGHGIGEVLNGAVADVRVWDRVLAAAEIADMVDPTSDANVATTNVGQWLVEPETCAGDPAMCLDTSAYAHDLNLSGAVSLTTQGQAGSGLAYAGTDGVATTIDPNTGVDGPVLRTDQSFTVSAWVDLAQLPTHNYTAVGQSGAEVSAFYLGARMFADGPRWAFAMKDVDAAAGSGWMTVNAPSALTAADVGTWAHLVAVYDAAAQTMTLYVNGAAVGSHARPAAPWNATNALTIGAALWTPSGGPTALTDHWNGTIDTVYAFAGAVPASSINRIP